MIAPLVILMVVIALAVMAQRARTAGSGYVRPGGFGGWRRLRQPPLRDHKPARPRRDFRAVSIVPGDDCCRAVTHLAGKRALPGQLPSLPLPQCDAPECRCRMTTHPDRRAPLERRRRDVKAEIEPERRDRDDRRSPGRPPLH
jgi:hypothetical protein